MDANRNFNQSLNGSFDLSNGQAFYGGTPLDLSGSFQGQSFAGAMDYSNLPPEEILRLQQINQQQIQQLAAQMAQLQAAGSSQLVSPASPLHFSPQNSQVFAPNVMSSPTLTRHGLAPTLQSPLNTPVSTSYGMMNTSLTNQQFSPNVNNNQVYRPPAYPNTQVGINGQIHNQTNLVGQTNREHLKVSERNIATPNTLPLTHMNSPRAPQGQPSYHHPPPEVSTYQGSPAMTRGQGGDAPDGPSFMSRPRQQMSAPPPTMTAFSPQSDRSSVSSSTGSPMGSSFGPVSPDSSWSDASGPLSPQSPRQRADPDMRSPIQNTPLQMKTRYPQDKCYSCMKKVYKMESIGPVKGVVYHKGCFRCKVCQTQLTMKNFNHSQSDSYDLNVYCKSHQPAASEKGPKLGADSIEIKSALTAPKKGAVIPESERVPIKDYHIDVNAIEIEHARKVPVQNLQGGNKVRNNAWSKSKREQYHAPSTEIVRYDDPVAEVDPDSYTRHQVENTPDY